MGIQRDGGRHLKQWRSTQSLSEYINSDNNPSADGTGEVTGAVTSSFDSLDLSQQGQFTISTPGDAFQFTQSYSGPGLTNQTIIQRLTEVESVTSTTSTFTQ